MKNVSDSNGIVVHSEENKRVLGDREHRKRSQRFFKDIVVINDKKNKYGSSIFVSISKRI